MGEMRNISLKKQQFVVTHTIRETEIPALPDSSVTNTTSVKMLKQEFVVTHTIRETEIPALPDSSVTNTPSVKMLCPQKSSVSLYFRENITCLSGGLLRVG